MNGAEKEKRSKHLINGYMGTYFSEESKGVYWFRFDADSGELEGPELFYEAKNAKWVSLYGNRLAFPIEKEERAGICFLELAGGSIRNAAQILEEKHTPCCILQEENLVYTANYHEGTVMIYHMENGSPSVVSRIENGIKAGCHQILRHEAWLVVPCLEQNRIRLFDKENGFAPAGEIPFPEGCGPRHGVFNRTHTRFYLVSEWSNELFVFQVKGIQFELLQKLSVLANDKPDGAAAAIRLTGDERFLYVSVRGQNLLAAVDVSRDTAAVSGWISSGGEHPRDFILSGDERFVLIANRQEGGIVCRKRDQDSGQLQEIISRIQAPECVSLVLEES